MTCKTAKTFDKYALNTNSNFVAYYDLIKKRYILLGADKCTYKPKKGDIFLGVFKPKSTFQDVITAIYQILIDYAEIVGMVK